MIFYATFPKTEEYHSFKSECLSDAYQYMFENFGYTWGLLYSDREGFDPNNLKQK